MISVPLVTTLLLFPQLAFGHGGGLDAKGCHQNRETGEYHCHHKEKYGDVLGTASVIDGDTLEIRGTRIRLHGIDAPESAQLCHQNGTPWRCGQQAALQLSEFIGRTTISCEHRNTDRYGRIVATCFLGSQDLNRWMVSEGWALAYRQYSADYIIDEAAAKAAGQGVWTSQFEAPWLWRRR